MRTNRTSIAVLILELALSMLVLGAQLACLWTGWGELQNIHQGFPLLIAIGVLGTLNFILELILLWIGRRNWHTNFLISIPLTTTFFLLIGWHYGG